MIVTNKQLASASCESEGACFPASYTCSQHLITTPPANEEEKKIYLAQLELKRCMELKCTAISNKYKDSKGTYSIFRTSINIIMVDCQWMHDNCIKLYTTNSNCMAVFAKLHDLYSYSRTQAQKFNIIRARG